MRECDPDRHAGQDDLRRGVPSLSSTPSHPHDPFEVRHSASAHWSASHIVHTRRDAQLHGRGKRAQTSMVTWSRHSQATLAHNVGLPPHAGDEFAQRARRGAPVHHDQYLVLAIGMTEPLSFAVARLPIARVCPCARHRYRARCAPEPLALTPEFEHPARGCSARSSRSPRPPPPSSC